VHLFSEDMLISDLLPPARTDLEDLLYAFDMSCNLLRNKTRKPRTCCRFVVDLLYNTMYENPRQIEVTEFEQFASFQVPSALCLQGG